MYWGNTKKLSIKLNKKLYKKLDILCDGKDINQIVSSLIEEYVNKNITIGGEMTNVVPPMRLPIDKNKSLCFKVYLTQVALTSTNKHYSPNVSNSYSVAVNTTSKIMNRNIWEVTSSSEMSEIIEQMQKNEEFIKKDNESSKSVSNGIKRYREFLEYIEQHPEFIDTQEDEE